MSVGERGEKGDHGQHGQQGEPGKRGERGPTNRKGLVGYLLLAAGVVAGLYGGYHNDQELKKRDNRQDAERRERVILINKINKAQCDEIEALKLSVRQEAIESYKMLDRNGRLLGITITPELRAASKANMERKLERYKAGTCPRATIR